MKNKVSTIFFWSGLSLIALLRTPSVFADDYDHHHHDHHNYPPQTPAVPTPPTPIVCQDGLKYTRVLSTRLLENEGHCEVSNKLQLTRVSQYYPKMNIELQVDAWSGTYTGHALYQDTLQDYYENDCSAVAPSPGTVPNPASSNQIPETIDEYNFGEPYLGVPYVSETSFEIDNPNLHDDISMSFEASAPMTDEDAKEAFAQLRKTCEGEK